jgi:hypothetical protein
MDRKTMLASISAPRNPFKPRQPVQRNIHDPEKPVESDAAEPSPPAFSVIGPTPRPTILKNPNSLGLEQADKEKLNGNGIPESRSDDPDYRNSNGEPMLSDAHTFTSSPVADVISLPRVESRTGGGVNFARSTSFAPSQYGEFRRSCTRLFFLVSCQ